MFLRTNISLFGESAFDPFRTLADWPVGNRDEHDAGGSDCENRQHGNEEAHWVVAPIIGPWPCRDPPGSQVVEGSRRQEDQA